MDEHEPKSIIAGDKSIVITSGELISRALFGLIAILITVAGFVGIQLWAQVEKNEAKNVEQDILDAKVIEKLDNFDKTVDGLRLAIEKLIEHEAAHRLRE